MEEEAYLVPKPRDVQSQKVTFSQRRKKTFVERSSFVKRSTYYIVGRSSSNWEYEWTENQSQSLPAFVAFRRTLKPKVF